MQRYRSALQWLESQRSAMGTLLHGWAGINSGTFNPLGLETMAELVAAEFSQLAASARLREPGAYEIVDHHGHLVHVPLGKNLHVQQRMNANVKVLLAIHMDTVYGPESKFQHVEQLDDNTLRGPGVADAKGGLVVMLFALRAFERFCLESSQLDLGWEVIVNSDEEIGSPGSLPLFEEAARRVQLGLLFEPSLPGGQLVSSRKGSGNFSIVSHGRAAHSGRDFQHGINAVVAAAEATTQLSRLTGQWTDMTLNVARIDGGGPSNMVPPTSVIRLNIRYLDQRHEREILAAMQRILDDVAARSGVQFELHGQFASPPKPLTGELSTLLCQFQHCGEELGLQIDWAPSGGACDGNRLAACGVPNIDTLGVRGGNIHSRDEFVLLDSLTERAKLTAFFLMQLADGVLPLPRPGTDRA